MKRQYQWLLALLLVLLVVGCTTADNSDRRGEYLLAASELLVAHLQTLVDEWDPAVSGNYREAFLAENPDDAIQKILTGMGVLSKRTTAQLFWSRSTPCKTRVTKWLKSPVRWVCRSIRRCRNN